MRIVVDTSALVALYIPEKLSKYIREEMEKNEEYHFLDLIYYEFTNVIRKRVARGEISNDKAMEILKNGYELISNSTVHEGKEVIMEAYEMGLKYSITVYDASLIALANKINGKILTTDLKLLNSLKNTQLYSLFLVGDGVS
ncbi:twitching motility protein PilT [Sulfolobus sp. A20]|uniref:type II toxin-antitoxin system VapC family toxin n=1 Tax=Sulfolobaceae TaxID=118883 RepID=UPI0008461EB5|nr:MULTISPECIES: type II toxin-antitoxin system VapC family toxin [unclassified Sulfolobus]TRM75366.1 PIN domain-containing protein [Sulfolobus sp. E5]TRM76080.1 PIN domain-containing protein [Sulfolobus sp. A20-N-F8]TRM79431.1 PIN domain-containing protein [Sulfolobus sp. B5]TRM81257.1 PIN domain-containing protein [Sulfolobus sp. D5]TRM88555.1 PIN domain-containing protein [Sulfolobus sp. C3]TRM89122.1 PIN domain-containing protein [Sulfolobus sp. E3]TRM94812.1 PIN domain-containing protei